MLRQDVVVDGLECISTGEAECKDTEVTLESRVDSETAGRGIHTGQVLSVVDVLERQLRPVVPMAVVEVLAHQSVWLYCEVLVDLIARIIYSIGSTSLCTPFRSPVYTD